MSWRGLPLDDSQALSERMTEDPDRRVVVELESGERYVVRARDVESREDAVVVREKDGDPVEIPLEDVERISTREFSWWRTSALTVGIVAVTGTIIFLLLFAFVSSIEEAVDSDE